MAKDAAVIHALQLRLGPLVEGPLLALLESLSLW
jgi:hypothetical protein